ncbi:DUF3558 domain-containing protein [Nocardia sp. NBC_01329]|uniref:DUF3558 domain-containing protein n=1 Tax=Nocardia sp. NBC_01329 TaxID=2903594 RepID=UPI002E1436AE|nr:DUF3558 domain-containing protein [Nocardia sp. NBC_01329]
MTTRSKLATAAASCALVLLSAGCAQESQTPTEGPSASAVVSGSSESASPRSTLTAPRLQPPSQQNEYTTEGRPEVVFDPCTWISDDAITAAGLDPESRRRGRDLVAEYTFLTCDFDGSNWDLQIDSGNVSWQEDLDKNSANSEPLKVNGREAVWVRDPQLVKTCDIHVRTEVGFVIFSTEMTFEGSEAGLARCDGVLHIAETLEPSIGMEN